jgi:hypothetical protein
MRGDDDDDGSGGSDVEYFEGLIVAPRISSVGDAAIVRRQTKEGRISSSSSISSSMTGVSNSTSNSTSSRVVVKKGGIFVRPSGRKRPV